MKLVIAEKPSVAQSIAKVIGANKREDGYLEGNGYIVSWCVGHLVELASPEVYDEKTICLGIILKHFLLICDTVAFSRQFIVSGKSLIKSGDFSFFRSFHNKKISFHHDRFICIPIIS